MMPNRDVLRKSSPIIVTVIIAILSAWAGYYFNETSTDVELKLASVNYERNHELLNNNETESLNVMPKITLYNTKRSDYPARLFSAKNQIIDCETQQIISEAPSGLNEAIVLPGEDAVINSHINMVLNKTGNYTLQTTVYYLDLKTEEIENIYFYIDFTVYANSDYNKDLYPYKMRFTNYNPYNSQWNFGKKYPLIN